MMNQDNFFLSVVERVDRRGLVRKKSALSLIFCSSRDYLHVSHNDEQSPLQLLLKEVLNVSSNSLPIFVLVFTSSLYMLRAIQVYVAWSEGWN